MPVAAKVMLVSKVSIDTARKEATIHQMMDHPNLVRYFYSKVFNDSIIMLMELATGGELFDRIGIGA